MCGPKYEIVADLKVYVEHLKLRHAKEQISTETTFVVKYINVSYKSQECLINIYKLQNWINV